MKKATMLFLLIFTCTFSYAQSVISGEVRNEKSEPLNGVTVILENKSTKFSKSTITGADGKFSFANIANIHWTNAQISFRRMPKRITSGAMIFMNII